MRAILTTSLPQKTVKEIKQKAKKMGISVSSFILYLISLEKDLISEDEILKMAKQAKQAHKQGKTKKLNSLADLM